MPKIVYETDRDRIWSAGARRRAFPPGVVFVGLGQPDGPAYAAERDVEYAPSCALLIPRATLGSVGLFDPGYFFYYDDWDYCERVRLAGQTVRYVPSAVVYHKVSLSTARSARPARWWYVMGRSAVLYYRRYYRPFAPSLALYAGWFVARETVKGNARYLPLFLRGVLHALTGRPMLAPEALG
jgi:GT2 family glycosyltransferase